MITTIDTVFVMLANVTPVCILDRLLPRVANIGVSNENSCYPISIYFCSKAGSGFWEATKNFKFILPLDSKDYFSTCMGQQKFCFKHFCHKLQ